MLLAAVKILGIILLAVLAALALVLIAVLFAPLKYKTEGSFKGEPKASFSISWLFGTITLKGSVNNKDGLNYDFDYPFKGLKESFNKNKSQSRQKKNAKSNKAQKNKNKPQQDKRKPNPQGQPLNTAENKDKEPKSKKTAPQKQSLLTRLKNKLTDINAIQNKRDIISCFAKNIKYILSKQRLTVLRADILFGFDDPSLTGKVLGFLYASTIAVKKGINIQPDFEREIFEADADIKGRGNLFYIIVTIIKILLNKNVRSLIFKEV